MSTQTKSLKVLVQHCSDTHNKYNTFTISCQHTVEVAVTVKAVVVDTTAAEAEEGENFNCIQRFFPFKPFFSFIGLLVLHIFLHFTLLIQIMIKIHTVMVGVVMEAAAVDITEVVAEEVEGEKLIISNLVHKLFTFF